MPNFVVEAKFSNCWLCGRPVVIRCDRADPKWEHVEPEKGQITMTHTPVQAGGVIEVLGNEEG